MEPNLQIPKLEIKPEIKPDEKPGSTGFSSNLKTLRTYAGDMATALNEQQGSVIKIAMAEHSKKEREIDRISPASKKNLTLLIVSFVAVVLAVGAIFYVTKIKKDTVVAVDKKPTINSLVLSETSESIATEDILTGKELSDTIAVLVARERPVGVSNIILTTPTETGSRLLMVEEFLNKLETDRGGALTRSLLPEYMIGIHTIDTAHNPFIFLKTTSYEIALAGMLDWENKLFDNFYGIFGVAPTSDNKYLFEKKFEDIIVENRDGRILRDSTGAPVLIYIFLSTDTMLLTNSYDTIKEVISRLEAARSR